MKSLAIIGTGISAMAVGHFLKGKYDITFFEKNHYPGGHSNTIAVDEEGRDVWLDTGFMVFNHVTYPNLVKLFEELNVETMPTNMSFSVQHVPSGLEYCGTGVNGLFAQRKNILNPRFIKMLMDIKRFNAESVEVLDHSQYANYTIGQYIQEKGYGREMLDKYLVPMSSAVWSTPPEKMEEFPIITLVAFFKNHGFLGMNTQHQWYTPTGGSRHYRDKILSHFGDRVLLNRCIKGVIREGDQVVIVDEDGHRQKFDYVVIGAHADEALSMLVHPTEEQENTLKHFRYAKNRATVHTDVSIMPKTRRAWSSWNYRIKRDQNGRLVPTTIYYMNKLQKVSQRKNYFVSINELGEIDEKKIMWEMLYDHPIYDLQSTKAQRNLKRLNKSGPIYFCGAYFRYGFHEDGLTAGLEIVKAMTGNYPQGYQGFL